jgi:hypothetical protein
MPQTGSGNRKGQAQNYRRDVALSGIISIFVEQFCTPDPTLCGGFAAQVWPPPTMVAQRTRGATCLHYTMVHAALKRMTEQRPGATNTVTGKNVAIALIQCQ